MNTTRSTEDKEAVSPVIAVILMVAITIVLAAIMFTSLHPWYRTHEQTPTVGAVCQISMEDYCVHVEKMDPDATDITKVNYVLLDNHSNAIPGVQGKLRDILNLDYHHESTNITFQDNDRDEKLSAGDVFIIKEVANGGQASNGYFLLLKFEPNGEKMNGRGTKLV